MGSSDVWDPSHRRSKTRPEREIIKQPEAENALVRFARLTFDKTFTYIFLDGVHFLPVLVEDVLSDELWTFELLTR